MIYSSAILVFSIFLSFPSNIEGYGRLLDPPGRNSIWRVKEFERKHPPVVENDDKNDCGGTEKLYGKNGGKCGICGDDFETPPPRDNEGGGKYARGIITRKFKAGEIMEVVVELTKSHGGFFEFRLCAHNNPGVPSSQNCLDKNVLESISGETKIPADKGEGKYNVSLKLPSGVHCTQCVLQWNYVGGDKGNGKEEISRSCADIAIE